MPPTLEQVQSLLVHISETFARPFWARWDFWLSIIVGAGGLGFSIAAFLEARNAKHAATEAGRTVKLQTTTIELNEISHKLDKIQPQITFNEARDILSEISRRLRRIASPFSKDGKLKDAIVSLIAALEGARLSLQSVRPNDPTRESQAPQAIYFGIEDAFSTINNCIADLLGLFEKQTIDIGDQDADE